MLVESTTQLQAHGPCRPRIENAQQTSGLHNFLDGLDSLVPSQELSEFLTNSL